MSWTELNFSKGAIRRAGDYLSETPQHLYYRDIEKYSQSFAVLSNWRSSHAYPMQSMLGHFRNIAFEFDDSAIIVQRLKRTPSIISKLVREKGMRLDRMEDIAGCRIVTNNKGNVYSIRNRLVNSRTRNILRRERDYIEFPKKSGYRGLHLIYKYNGAKHQYSSHCVELQLRSKVQHSWATTVEVVSAFTGQALKASQGEESWLNFFQLASLAFEDIENRRISKNSSSKERIALINCQNKLGVLPRLRAFTVSTRYLENASQYQNEYFLLTLNIEDSTMSISGFPKEQLFTATETYAELEKELQNQAHKDVVLVSASSLNGLRRAYPNYFADTREFSKNLERVINIKSS